MLPKARKVPLRLLRNFFQVARRKRTHSASLFYLPQEKTQFSVLISKKTTSLASQRNTIKRTIYQVLSQEWPRLESLNKAIVIAVYARAEQVTERFVKELIQECLTLKSNEKTDQI